MSSSKGAVRRRLTAPRVALSVLTSLCILVSGCGSGSSGLGGGEPLSEAQQALYDQAVNTGGNVRIFIGTTGKEELDGLAELFNERYPNVALDITSGTGDQIQERFLSEKRAGLNNVDVVSMAGIAPFQEINQEGYLAQFTPEDAQLFNYDPQTFIDGVAYGFASLDLGICYNPTKLTDEEVGLLHTYQGWTDPRWKGRASIVRPDGYGYRRGWTYWVYEDPGLGEPWLRALAELDPTVFPNANSAAPQISAGEYDILINSPTAVQKAATRDGAPFRCTTGEYAPAYTFAAALAKDAPNTPGGQLFINWLLSEDGQQAVQDTVGYTARRKGFDVPVIDEDWWQPPQDERFVDEAAVKTNQQALTTLFDSLIGGAAR